MDFFETSRITEINCLSILKESKGTIETNFEDFYINVFSELPVTSTFFEVQNQLIWSYSQKKPNKECEGNSTYERAIQYFSRYF